MKIGFFAETPGPSLMFKILVEGLHERGHETVSFLRSAASEKIARTLDACDVVVMAISSFGAQEERAVMDMMNHETKVLFMEDRPGLCIQTEMKGFATKRSAGVIVSMSEDLIEARKFGYPSSFYSGAPAHWIQGYGVLTGGENVRPKLSKVQDVDRHPLSDDDVFVLLGGIKDSLQNNDALREIVSAGREVFGNNLCLCFKGHPFEEKYMREHHPEGVYEEALTVRRELMNGLWTVPYGSFSMTELVRASDIPCFSGGATDSIIAAYARISGLYLTSRSVRERNVNQGIENGLWFVHERGGLLLADVDYSGDVVKAFKELASSEGSQRLRTSQERAFPMWGDDVDPVRGLLDVIGKVL